MEQSKTPKVRKFMRFSFSRTMGLLLTFSIVALLTLQYLSVQKNFELSQKLKGHRQSLDEGSDEFFKNLYLAYFAFAFDDEFVPALRERIQKVKGLNRIWIVTSGSELVFDSGGSQSTREVPEDLQGLIGSSDVQVAIRGFSCYVSVPSPQLTIVYRFFDQEILASILIKLFLVLTLTAGVLWWLQRVIRPDWFQRALGVWGGFWGMRNQFLFTIVAVNLIAAGIIFFTLSELQKREEADQVHKRAAVFSEFATESIVRDYTQYYFFYHDDKFVPSIRKILSTNENLVGFRIASGSDRKILFDSRNPNASEDLQELKLSQDEEVSLGARNHILRVEIGRAHV